MFAAAGSGDEGAVAIAETRARDHRRGAHGQRAD